MRVDSASLESFRLLPATSRHCSPESLPPNVEREAAPGRALLEAFFTAKSWPFCPLFPLTRRGLYVWREIKA